MVAFFHLFGNLFKIIIFKKIRWPLFLKFGLPSIIASLSGAYLISYIPSRTVKIIFGVFLIVFVIYSFSKKIIKLPDNNYSAVGGGIGSGFLAGFIGTGGAIRALFLNAFSLPKLEYIATSAAIAIVIDLSRIMVYLRQNFGSMEPMHYYYYLPILFIIALIGTYGGKKLVKIIPVEIFRKIILVALLIVGVKLILGV